MKKFLIIFLLIPFALSAQRVKYDTLFSIADMVATDTTVYRIFRNADGRYLELDIDSLSHNTDSVWVGQALDETCLVPESGFPVVASKAVYWNNVNGDTISRIGVKTVNWQGKYIGVRWKKVGSTSGVIVLIY